MARDTNKGNNEPLEQKLWKAADKLRKNMDAGEYKHIVLGLIFLKYISDTFEEQRLKLVAGTGDYSGADPEDPDEYRAENVFFVPGQSRWIYLLSEAKQPTIGKVVDDAMDAIEKVNVSLRGVLPKVYARQNLDKQSLGELIDLIGTIALGDTEARSRDVLGHVYEYFLGQFALAEGKKGGQFYTPRSVVELLVEMLQPYNGRVFDPCCGSGGMFIQSAKFIQAHADHYRTNGNGKNGNGIDPNAKISIYGQESNQTTWRLCKMNLAIRHIDSSNVKWNNEGSFLNDAHKDLRADFIIANPPFNDSDWSGDILRTDARWHYGTPPTGNANYAWIQHFLYHLAPEGIAGFVMAKGSLTSNASGEGEIRKSIVNSDLVECIVNLPAKLFLNTGIPACLWFMARNKSNSNLRSRNGEVIFIDARNHGHLINRRNLEFSFEDIQQIANTYHQWRCIDGQYNDVPGYCKSVTLDEIKDKDYILTPGRYVGLQDEVDDINFREKFSALKVQLEQQFIEEARLNESISINLAKIVINE